MTRRKDPTEIRVPVAREDLPAFAPVPVKFRHDGWTPERQRAFIGALADTGSISRACAHVNMSKEGAYYLRRRPGSESFRRAWECALDLGVQRLKDEVFERALHGQLSPVFVAGKLKGFRRIKNDRLLMFALRMNMRGPDGRRLSASYFDPEAFRLSGSDLSSSSEAIGHTSTPPSHLREGPGVGPSINLTRAEKDDLNAAMVEHFDPVDMTLAEIEAMQKMLAEAAARRRAEDAGPPEADLHTDFFMLGKDKDFKAAGELEDLTGSKEDELEPFNPDEDDWQSIGGD